MTEALDLQSLDSTPQVSLNMISIASGKGGVGKTWLAITLAQAMARASRKTLLFDGDLGLANVDIQLGLAPEHDLGGALSGRYSLKQSVTRFEAGRFDVIAGRSGSASLANLPVDRLAALGGELAVLARDYETVIVDIGAGIDRSVRRLAAQAAICLVVTTDEPTALTDAYAFIKLSLLQDPAADLRVVINMASTDAEGQATYDTLHKACDSFLKASPPLAGIIRRDDKVKDSIRNQMSILTRHPNSAAATDVERIARNLPQDRARDKAM